MAKRNDNRDDADDTTETTASADTSVEDTDARTETPPASEEPPATPAADTDAPAVAAADSEPVILDYAPDDVMAVTRLAVKSRHGAPYRRCGLHFGSRFVIVERAQLPDDGAWARLAADVHLEVRVVADGATA